jgi:hypothetical protein
MKWASAEEKMVERHLKQAVNTGQSQHPLYVKILPIELLKQLFQNS